MNFDHSSNPTFSTSRLNEAIGAFAGDNQVMTHKGAATKTLLLMALVLLTGSISWKLFGANSPMVMPLMIGGGIGALVFGLISCFKPEKSYIFGPLYALCEGLLLGALSAMYSTAVNGIVGNAIVATIAVSVVVFLCYRAGILRASNTFVKVIVYATLGIGAFYLISIVAGLFGVNMSVMQLGTVGIIIQLVIVGVAALNLVLDLDMIDRCVEAGAPARMEWYCAYGLMVTLVWIYIEILRLLFMLARRD